MGDYDEFGELYADLEDPVIVGVPPAAEAEEENKNEMEERGAGYENGAMDSGSSSDSEDDIQIVLNEEDYTDKFTAQLLAEGRDFEEDEGDDLVIVTGSDCSGKEHNRAEQVHSADGLLQGNGDRGNATKGAHRNWSRPCLAGSAFRSWNSLSGINHCDHLTMSYSLGKSSHNSGFPMAFPNGCDFYLPRNRSIFNIDVESFECKPWRFNGVDITDYFNFGLDEDGWRTYCNQLVHFQQNMLPLHESSNLNKPKGQAIQVESGNGDRIPSIDIRKPRNRDSDVVIQITARLAVEDVFEPIINIINHADDNGSKNELLLNSKNELRKSPFNAGTCALKCEGSSNSSEFPHQYMKKPFDEKLDIMNCGRDCPSSMMSLSKPDAIIADHYSSSPKSSDLIGSFEASRDEVSLEKVPSPECVNLNSDSLLQESFLSHCYPSSESGSDTNNRTSCGGHSPESLLDLNYCQQKTHCKVVELNLSSDDEIAFPVAHRQKIDGEHQTKHSVTLVRQWDEKPDERVHSSQGGKISLTDNVKYNNENEVNAASFLAHSNGNDEDPSPVRNREKRTTARDVKRRKNGCYNNRRAQCNSRAQDIVNRDYLQSTSRNMSLYDKRVCKTSRRVDGHGMIMKAHYNSLEAKDCHREISLDEFRERSLDKYFGRCVPHFDEEEEIFIDKYDNGSLRRLQELDSHGKSLFVNLERSSRYLYNHEDSRLYEDGLHPRLYREAYDEDKRGWHEDDSHRNQVPSLFKTDKRNKSHSGHSHNREAFSQLHSKHGIFTKKKNHPFSRTGFNLDDDQFPAELKKAYPGNNAYNVNRKSSLVFPRLLAEEEVSIRHHDSNKFSSPKRYTLYGTIQLQNGRVDKSLISEQKSYDNHIHNSRGHKQTVSSCKDSDSGSRVGSLSDNFVKVGHELVNRGYRKTVNEHLNGWKVKTKEKYTSRGGRIHLGTDITSFKESRDSNDNEDSSYYNMKMTSNYHSMTKNSNKNPITEEEMEELEEGQLIEESHNHETTERKCNSGRRTPALTAKAKMDLTDPIKKIKLAGRYDKNHLLKSLAKMEKRLERFKDPIPLKKETENCGNIQPVTVIEDEIKQQRPTRKRRWGSS